MESIELPVGALTVDIGQAVVSGVVVGSILGLLAAGIGLIIGVTGRFHFAYATTFVLSAYATTTAVSWGAPLLPSILVGLAVGVVTGCLIEAFLYQPLASRAPHAALLAVFVTSLGVVIVGENAIRLTWGSASHAIDTGFEVQRIALWREVGLTNLDVVSSVLAIGAVLSLWLFLRLTSYGRVVRAVQDNIDMAKVVGIRTGAIYILVFALGSLLAGIGAILMTMRGALLPDSGLQPTFRAFVVVFLAGVASGPLRFLIVGLLLGIVQTACDIWISASWSTVVIFAILFVYVALTPYIDDRPRFGRRWRRRRLETTPG